MSKKYGLYQFKLNPVNKYIVRNHKHYLKYKKVSSKLNSIPGQSALHLIDPPFYLRSSLLIPVFISPPRWTCLRTSSRLLLFLLRLNLIKLHLQPLNPILDVRLIIGSFCRPPRILAFLFSKFSFSWGSLCFASVKSSHDHHDKLLVETSTGEILSRIEFRVGE